MPSRVWEWRIWIRSIELGDMAEEAQGILLDLDGNILSNLANLTKFVELAWGRGVGSSNLFLRSHLFR